VLLIGNQRCHAVDHLFDRSEPHVDVKPIETLRRGVAPQPPGQPIRVRRLHQRARQGVSATSSRRRRAPISSSRLWLRCFGQPCEVTAQTSVSLDPSRDNLQLSTIRTWGCADPCAVDRDLHVIRGVHACAPGALPFILLTIERSGFDPPTGFDGAAPHAAIRDLRATKREQSAHQGRRPPTRHSAPHFASKYEYSGVARVGNARCSGHSMRGRPPRQVQLWHRRQDTTTSPKVVRK
jgi:hypothetical protein